MFEVITKLVPWRRSQKAYEYIFLLFFQIQLIFSLLGSLLMSQKTWRAFLNFLSKLAWSSLLNLRKDEKTLTTFLPNSFLGHCSNTHNKLQFSIEASLLGSSHSNFRKGGRTIPTFSSNSLTKFPHLLLAWHSLKSENLRKHKRQFPIDASLLWSYLSNFKKDGRTIPTFLSNSPTLLSHLLLACHSMKSESRVSPEVLIMRSTGGESEV